MELIRAVMPLSCKPKVMPLFNRDLRAGVADDHRVAARSTGDEAAKQEAFRGASVDGLPALRLVCGASVSVLSCSAVRLRLLNLSASTGGTTLL